MRKIIFVFLFSFLSITPVHADSMTGQQWLNHCDSPLPIDNLNCTFYLQGIRDMFRFWNNDKMTIYRNMDGRESPVVETCIPKGVNLGQEIKIIKKYLHNNPESLHSSLSGIYSYKMAATFPCDPRYKIK